MLTGSQPNLDPILDQVPQTNQVGHSQIEFRSFTTFFSSYKGKQAFAPVLQEQALWKIDF